MSHGQRVRNGHLADNHCLKFVLWPLPANDCNHGIQFGRIDFAISLTECLGDTFHFDLGDGRTRGAKGRHQLAAPAVHIRMPWTLNNLSCAVFRLVVRMSKRGGISSTAPTYRDLATKGLIRKDYLNGDAGTGGVYLWENRQAAEAWFTESKLAELTERFGARPRLTWYDTRVTVDNLKGETRVNRHALPSAAE